MATTAVVAGTAAHMGAKSAQRNAAEAQAQVAPAPVATAPQPADSPEIEQLKQLAALKDQGILSEEEFTAKKAQILGI